MRYLLIVALSFFLLPLMAQEENIVLDSLVIDTLACKLLQQEIYTIEKQFAEISKTATFKMDTLDTSQNWTFICLQKRSWVEQSIPTSSLQIPSFKSLPISPKPECSNIRIARNKRDYFSYRQLKEKFRLSESGYMIEIVEGEIVTYPEIRQHGDYMTIEREFCVHGSMIIWCDAIKYYFKKHP